MNNLDGNPILDRLFRHMAWANTYLLERLETLPAEAFALKTSNSEWSVGDIAMHFVRSAGFYVSRLGEEIIPFDYVVPTTSEDISRLGKLCAGFDLQLRELAVAPDGITTYIRDGKTIHRARSTILGQSIHHATEHRAQIAGALVANGINVIDLDEIDVWGLGDAEGLGQ